MGLGGLNFVTHFWRSLIFSIQICYRSIYDHPFISIAVFILYVLHTFLPSVFGFLVTSSPILVCTAVLLGTLLNLGHSQKKPEVQEKNTCSRISSQKTDDVVVAAKDPPPVEKDNVVVAAKDPPPVEKDKNISIVTTTHLGKKRELQRKVIGKERRVDLSASSSSSRANNGLIDRTVVVEEQPKEKGILGRKKVIQKGFGDSDFIKKREIPKEEKRIGKGVADRNSEVSKNKDKGLKVDKNNKPTSGAHLNSWLQGSSSSSSGNRVHEGAAESSDCGSDQAQCSSPLASIAEIIPVLDELHPLLDFKTPQSIAAGIEESDAPSEWSDRSIDGSADSEEEDDDDSDEVENQREMEEEEEEANESDVEGIKSVLTWTEYDERNLEDLGTSELERNQRLETLVQKRRARKTLSMDVDINLIDLEIDEPPTQIPPIVTSRPANPFDLPYYSNETGETQPVPASAPSVLLPRRNPFDLPFEPIEERPHMNAENVQQVFLPPAPDKDMYFCRHQSFSWGNSSRNQMEKEKHVTDSSPFTRIETERNVYRPALQRQFTEKRESKLTAVLEHESSPSIEDEEEDHKDNGEHDIHEKKDKKDINESELLKEESEASEGEDIEVVEVEQEDIKSSSSSVEVVEVEQEDIKSSSSSVEVNENTLHENTSEVEPEKLEQTKGDSDEGTSYSVHPSQLRIETEVKSMDMDQAEERPIEEPVYDSSPSAMGSITFEEAIDSHLDTPRVSDKKSALSNGNTKSETKPTELAEISEENVNEIGVLEDDKKQDDPVPASNMPEMPSEVQEVDVEDEFLAAASSPPSTTDETVPSVEKATVQQSSDADQQESQGPSIPQEQPTNTN